RFDSLFMVIGIIISVATLTVAHSIFEGYETVLKRTILGVNSHIYFFNPGEDNLREAEISEIQDYLQIQPEYFSSARIIMTQVMAVVDNRIEGCLLRGIEWQRADLPTLYRQYVFQGDPDLDQSGTTVIGYRLARELNVDVGDTIKLISPINSRITPLGMKPREEKFRIVGLYRSGMYEYDSKYVFLDLADAAAFTGNKDSYSMLEVRLNESAIEKADYLAWNWERFFNSDSYRFQISSWIDFNGSLFSLLKLEKWVIFIILSFLILIASFNVVSSVSTSILEKRKELGIMKAFGTPEKLLKMIFLGKIMIMSAFAVISGILLGILLSLAISRQTFFLLKADVYFLENINVRFYPESLLLIVGVALLIVFLAALIPLRRITDLGVTDILRKK
ncbi:MAG: ABC transporter permease, partial [Calditrichaeota bacterium]